MTPSQHHNNIKEIPALFWCTLLQSDETQWHRSWSISPRFLQHFHLLIMLKDSRFFSLHFSKAILSVFIHFVLKTLYNIYIWDKNCKEHLGFCCPPIVLNNANQKELLFLCFSENGVAVIWLRFRKFWILKFAMINKSSL